MLLSMSSATRVKIAALAAVLGVGALSAGAFALRADHAEDSNRVSRASETRSPSPESPRGGRDEGGDAWEGRPEPSSDAESTEVVAPDTNPAVVVDPDEVTSEEPGGGYEAEPQEPEDGVEVEPEDGVEDGVEPEVEADTESADRSEAD
jgi:hypothetical protein